MTTTIHCPKCNHEFQPEEALQHQVKHLVAQKEFELQQAFDQKEKTLRAFQAKLTQKDLEIENTVNKKLMEKEKELEIQLKEKVKGQYQLEISELQKEITEKQKMVNDAKEKELELARLKRRFDEREKEYELKYEEKLFNERKRLEDLIATREQQKHDMRYSEKEKQLEDLKKQLEDLKRKADQGSVQLQGEVQELAIERILREMFPHDEIMEVGKGQRGGDSIQVVKDKYGRTCGRIIYESKRTKTFKTDWIPKLKQDQQRENAQVAVIVTEQMPEGMTAFGCIDSICICTFSSLPIVAALTREKLIELYCAKEVNINRADKMATLYNYLISVEFKLHIEEIIKGFQCLKERIEKERRYFEKNWNEQEKQLLRVMQNTAQMYGSIKGIAGSSLPNIEVLELPE